LNTLKKLLNFVTPEPKVNDVEYFAKSFTNTLKIMGYESYDVWQIAEQMQEYSLNPQDYPDLFIPHQRLQRKHYLAK